MRRNGKERKTGGRSSRRTAQPSLIERVRRAISTLVIPGNRGVSRLPFHTLSSYLSFFLARPRALSCHGRADSRLEKLNLPAIQQLSFQFKSHRGKEENGLLVFEIVSNIFPWFSSQSSLHTSRSSSEENERASSTTKIAVGKYTKLSTISLTCPSLKSLYLYLYLYLYPFTFTLTFLFSIIFSFCSFFPFPSSLRLFIFPLSLFSPFVRFPFDTFH